MLRRTRRIVRGQVVECGRNTGCIEIVPEWRPLPSEHCFGRLVIDRPEVELQAMVADEGPVVDSIRFTSMRSLVIDSVISSSSVSMSVPSTGLPLESDLSMLMFTVGY